jgi:proteasome assembly chaperone (PAC2) family protein
MEEIRFEDSPRLSRPVMVCAFEGWNDATEAASGAVAFLRSRWQADKFATLDPETFYDFQVRRPRVTLVDGITRRVTWPQGDFFHAPIPGADRDAILFLGVEPNFRWRAFVRQFVELAKDREAELVVTLGALLADVPHTRDIRVVGTAGRPDTVERLGLVSSRYEGPTGITGVLHDAMATAGLESVSLWASLPHYVASGPNPKGTVALVKRFGELVGSEIDTTELEGAATAWMAKVSEIVAANPEIGMYVRQLEAVHDQREAGQEADEIEMGEELVEELERFLREQEGGSGGGPGKSRGPA